jgi:hypothetical protein
MTKIITWDFFHPYFYLLLNKYKTCELGTIKYNESEGKLNADFCVKENPECGNQISLSDITIQLFTFIDEMCGLFVYKLDEQTHFTTTINLEIINPIKIDDRKFHIVLNLLTNSERKKKIGFRCYNKQALAIEGYSIFKKPKKDIPMAKF